MGSGCGNGTHAGYCPLTPDYADAHFNLALLYLERTPPPIEMARRHYFFAIDLGAPRDEEIEKRLKKIDDSNSKK